MIRKLNWRYLDPIDELREAFESHPNLTLETSVFCGEGRTRTRIWWRDPAEEKRGALAEVKDSEIVPVTEKLLGELAKLRRGKAKGASA